MGVGRQRDRVGNPPPGREKSWQKHAFYNVVTIGVGAHFDFTDRKPIPSIDKTRLRVASGEVSGTQLRRADATQRRRRCTSRAIWQRLAGWHCREIPFRVAHPHDWKLTLNR